MNRICTICAWWESNGEKNKHLRRLHGLPLIAHTIGQAQRSGLFKAIAVSSDSSAILRTAAEYGVGLLIRRPRLFSKETVPKVPVIRHCVYEAEALTGVSFDTVVNLGATTPLRSIEDIEGAVALLEKFDAPNVISGTPSRRSPYLNMVELNQQGVPALVKRPESQIARRRNIPATFDLNASVYVWNRQTIAESDDLFQERTLFYSMPQKRSVDIDTEQDLAYVRFLMRGRERM